MDVKGNISVKLTLDHNVKNTKDRTNNVKELKCSVSLQVFLSPAIKYLLNLSQHF
jgi:hypothetical protein